MPWGALATLYGNVVWPRLAVRRTRNRFALTFASGIDQVWSVPRLPGTLLVMRTVISVPDETLERAKRAATTLGITTSEFFERAAESYLGELNGESIKGRVNAALDRIGDTDSSNRAAADAGRRRLSDTSYEW